VTDLLILTQVPFSKIYTTTVESLLSRDWLNRSAKSVAITSYDSQGLVSSHRGKSKQR